MMDCAAVRPDLLAARRGELSSEARAAIEEHLRTCDACRAIDAADDALSRALERLPLPNAPQNLRAAILARIDAPRPLPAARRVAFRAAALLAAACAIALVVFFSFRSSHANDPIVAEAVADHLRVLYAEHPIEVVSSDMHTVKPWFTGRLDFAPATAFLGDAEFPLEGGAVAYFLDRKAAALLFMRRLHRISVFVFPAEGLSLPTSPTSASQRGFHIVFFRHDDLGYALVSDVSEGELFTLAKKIAP